MSEIGANQVAIDTMAAYEEACALNGFYANRVLWRANEVHAANAQLVAVKTEAARVIEEKDKIIQQQSLESARLRSALDEAHAVINELRAAQPREVEQNG